MQRILVVDDAEINRELLYNILEHDYAIDMAEDGEQALQKMAEYRGALSALLLDLHMPGKDGFEVLAEMKKRGLMHRFPVLVISGEHAIAIESLCLEQGVSDFIHKPFEGSIVKRRIANAVELFTYKNQLEQKVEEQEKTLQQQLQIIRLQAEQLRDADAFHMLMMEYRAAIMEVETRLNILNAEFSQEYNRNPFESIKSRLKTPASIYEKLNRRGFPVTLDGIRENLTDVAGIRVICSFPDDIYRLADLLAGQDDIILWQKKDYIQSPKTNGYRSLHLILDVPIYLSGGKKHMKVEVQFRTIAMDFWASLEHKLKYKKNDVNAEEIVTQLRDCADSIEALDYQMQEIRNKIERSRG